MKIFIHEDFYCQIECIPEENYFLIQKTNHDLEINNSGFMSILERSQSAVQLSNKKIHHSKLIELLSGLDYIFYDEVEKGYNNTVIKMRNTEAYGFERLAVFAEFDNDKYLKALWICQVYDLKDCTKHVSNLINLLHQVGEYFNLILVDWNEEIAIRLTKLEIKKYLINNFYFDLN